MKVIGNIPPLLGVVNDHFWGAGHSWTRASAAKNAPGSVRGETLLGY